MNKKRGKKVFAGSFQMTSYIDVNSPARNKKVLVREQKIKLWAR